MATQNAPQDPIDRFTRLAREVAPTSWKIRIAAADFSAIEGLWRLVPPQPPFNA
jgi:hypothetical protein